MSCCFVSQPVEHRRYNPLVGKIRNFHDSKVNGLHLFGHVTVICIGLIVAGGCLALGMQAIQTHGWVRAMFFRYALLGAGFAVGGFAVIAGTKRFVEGCVTVVRQNHYTREAQT